MRWAAPRNREALEGSQHEIQHRAKPKAEATTGGCQVFESECPKLQNKVRVAKGITLALPRKLEAKKVPAVPVLHLRRGLAQTAGAIRKRNTLDLRSMVEPAHGRIRVQTRTLNSQSRLA